MAAPIFVWLSSAIRIALACALLICIAEVSREAVAVWCARQGTIEGLREAIRWDSGNPAYYARLARALQLASDTANPHEILSLYERATRLSPNSAEYWAGLAEAYEWVGREEDAARAYDRARELFPRSPDINWKLGNFYLRAGQTGSAIREFRLALLHQPEQKDKVFDVAWRAGFPPDQILAKLIPPRQEYLLAYLRYLMTTRHLDAAFAVWRRILSLPQSFDPKAAFPYMDALIEARRLGDLQEVWDSVARRFPAVIHSQSQSGSLIYNGGFEQEILNGGLGWRVVPKEGATVEIDRSNPYDGKRSLKILFDGKHNVDYSHVFQYVLVQPETSYRFVVYMRAENISSDSGPRFDVVDAYSRANLALETKNLLGTSGWAPQELEFRTGPDTRLLLVVLTRPQSKSFDNLVGGAVWLDDVSLTQEERITPPENPLGRTSGDGFMLSAKRRDARPK